MSTLFPYSVHELDKGHRYQLPALDGDLPQTLQFVKRCDQANPTRYPGNFNAYPGTTLQAVMRALIARLDYLNNQIPCLPNRFARFGICLAVWMLEYRAARRHGRSYWHGLRYASEAPMCRKCGHTGHGS